MKRLISLLSIMALCLAMSISVFAGDIPFRNGSSATPKPGDIPFTKEPGDIPFKINGILLSDAPVVLALIKLLGGRR
jgi:hypothetical protein